MTLALLFAALLSTAPAAAAIDCAALPWANVVAVGELSPKNARAMLKSGDYGEVARVARDKETAKLSLELGLKWQSAGNEAMIYDVDALAYVLRGRKSGGTTGERAAHKLLDTSEKITDYFKQFQFRNALRVLGTLRLMKRDAEADRLQKYLAGKYDPEALRQLRLSMNNTGRLPTHAKSVEFCKKILAL